MKFVAYVVPFGANLAILLLTGFAVSEPRFWVLLFILLAYQVVYGVASHATGFDSGLSRSRR